MEKQLIELLIEKGWHISTAESCTGGLLAARLTDVPGASAAIEECIVTYSNDAKMRELNVSEQTLARHGAVSVETAWEMCVGICAHTGAEVGIGITGIAGPGGGTAAKPVGTVCIGVCALGNARAERFLFDGSRSEVRAASCKKAMEMALEAVFANEQKIF